MNCKNCQHPLHETDNYCKHCGAKVIRQRISLRGIMTEWLTHVFGWDSQYFRTVRSLLLEPDVLLREYLEGTRKKYVHPFTFLMIGAAISLLVLTQFSEVFLQANKAFSDAQSEVFIQYFPPNVLEANHQKAIAEGDSLASKLSPKDYFKASQVERTERFQRLYLNYFNFAIILILPIFAMISRWVFGKPYNVGEHLVINAYNQGFLFLTGMILFVLAILISPSIYFYSVFIGLFFYSYSFGKLYKLSIGKAILKLFKFFGILLLFLLGLLVFGFIVGLVGSLLEK